MSDELKINVQVDADDSQARSKIDKLKSDIQNEKAANIRVGIEENSIKSATEKIDKLFNSLKRLSDFTLGDIGNIDNNLKGSSKSLERFEKTIQTIIDARKELSKLKDNSLGGLDLDKSNAVDAISSELKNNADLFKKIDELNTISYDISAGIDGYADSIRDASEKYNAALKENVFKEEELIQNSDNKARLNNINRQIKELKIIEDAFKELGIVQRDNAKAMYETYEGNIAHTSGTKFETYMAKTKSEEEVILKMAKELGTRRNQLQKQIENNVKKLSESDRQIYESLKKISDNTDFKNLIDNTGREYAADLLNSFLHDYDKVDLDFSRVEDIIRGAKRYQDAFNEIKKIADSRGLNSDYVLDFSASKGYNLEETLEFIDVDKLNSYNKELEKGLENQLKIISGTIDKIEDNLKDTTSKDNSLFDFKLTDGLIDSLQSIEQVLDKFSGKFSKAFTINGDSAASLDKIKDTLVEINKLTESQKQIIFDIGFDDASTKLNNIKNDILDIDSKSELLNNESFKGLVMSLTKVENVTGDAIRQIEKLKISASKEVVSKFSFDEDGVKQLETKTTTVNVAKRMKEITTQYGKYAKELIATQLELDKALNTGASEDYVNGLSGKIDRISLELQKIESAADEFKSIPDVFDTLKENLRSIDDITLENSNLDSIKFLDAAKLKESNTLLTKAKEAIKDINKYTIDLEKASNAGYGSKVEGLQSSIDARKEDLKQYRAELEKNKKAITELNEYEVRKARETANEIAGIRDKADKQTGTKTVDEQDVLLKKYKDGLLEIQKIHKSIVKEGIGSSRDSKLIQLDSTSKELNKILSQLNDVKREAAKNYELKIFNNIDRSVIDGLSKVAKEVNNIEDKFKKLSRSDYLNIDSSKFKEATKDIRELQDILSKGFTDNIDSSSISKMLEKVSELKRVSKDFELEIKIGKDADKIEQFTKKVVKDIENLRKEYGDLNGIDLKILDDLKKLEAGSDKLPSQMRKITQEIKDMGKEAKSLSDSGIKNFFDDLYDSMRTFTLGDIIGDAIQDGVSAIKDTVVELDNSMRDLMKVAPEGFRGTAEELKQVKLEAVEVAKSVGQTTEDVIQGMSKALQTGAKNMSDALEIAKASSLFANVGDIDQEQADTYIASVMSAFGGMENALKPVREQVKGMGEDYNNLTKFLDLANHAGNNFAISTADVGEALMRSGSVLSGFGITMEESVAMIVGANESIQNSEKVGTSLKTIAANLGSVKASAKDGTMEMNRTAKALKSIAGIDVWNKQTGEVKTMTETLSDLNKVWGELSQAEKIALSEGIAGKEHLNTFVALMDNWETVIQYQEEYANGWTLGSAAKENERYLDSIEGKWNKLRENLKSLTTTVLSSNMFKGLLDGAISFTDGLNKVFQTLDKFKLALPTTIGLVTSFGQILKSLSGNGDTTNILSSITNGFKELSSVSKTVDVTIGKNEKSFSRLTKNSEGLSKGAVKLSKNYSGLAISTQRIDKGSIKLEKSVKTIGKSFTQTAIGSNLAMVGTSLLNGALISLAGAGISIAIKMLSDYANRLEIAEEKSRANIDTLNGEIKTFEGKKKSISGIAEEYDTLSKKQKLSSDESERLKELTKQIADIMPELVTGYDESGDPILAMSGSASDLVVELEKALEVKKKLLTIEQGELAKNSIKQMNSNKGGQSKLDDSKGYSGEFGKLQKIEDNYNKELESIYKKRRDLEYKMMNSSSEDREKYARQISEIDNNLLVTQEKFNSEYAAQLSQIQTHSKNIGDYIFGNLEGGYSFDTYSEELQKSISGLKTVLDFSDVDSEEKMYATQNAIKQLADAANYGKIDLEKLKRQLNQANIEFAKTKDIEQYNKSISGLVEQVHAATGIDKDILTDIFSGLPQSLNNAETSLDKFMEKFGKTQNDLTNKSDEVAKAIKSQYDAIQRAIEATSKVSGIQEVDYETAVNLSIDENLPTQFRDMVRVLLNKGANATDVLEVAQKILVDLSDGEIDLDSYNKLLEDTFGEGAFELTPEILINTKIETAQTEEVINRLQNKFGELKEPVETIIKANSVTAEADANKVKFIYDSYPEQVETWIKTLGYESTYENILGITEIYNRLPEEKKTKLIAEGDNALVELERMNNLYQQLPPEVQTYIKANGYEALEQAQTVDDVLNNIPEEVKAKITADTAEAEQKLSIWEQLFGKKETKEVKYKATADVGDAQKKIENLDKAVTDYDKKHGGKTKKTNFNTDTSTASKNVTGLKKNVDDYDKKHTGKTKKTNFSTNTATASKNVTGLKNNVSGYVRSYGGKTYTTTFKVVTQYSTKGTPTSQSSRVSLGRAAQTVSTYTNDISEQSSSIQRSVSENISALEQLGSTTVQPNIESPKARGWSNPLETFNYGLNHFIELENKLKDIANQLDDVDEKSKNAFGEEKIEYLRQQDILLNKQKILYSDILDEMKLQQQALKDLLSANGLVFDDDNNISNYHAKLVSMNRELERLEENYNKASEASSNYNGDNEGTKNNLSNAVKVASNELDKYKNKYKEVKDAIDEYLNLTFDKIPDATNEWLSLNNSIKENKDSIEELQKALKNAVNEVNIGKYSTELDTVNRKVELLEKRISSLNGRDKVNAMYEKINLLKQQQQEAHELAEAYRIVEAQLRRLLSDKGFLFDNNGDISNFENLSSFIGTEQYDELKDLLDEYKNLHNEVIPGLSAGWWAMEEEIGNCISQAHKLELALKNIDSEIKLNGLDAALTRIHSSIKSIDREIDRAFGSQKQELLKDKIDLLRQEQDKLSEIVASYKEMAKVYSTYLQGAGFNFASDGSILNMDHIKNLLDDDRFEAIKDALENYIDLTQNKIPGVQDNWNDLQGSIADCGDAIEEAKKELEKFLATAEIDALLDKFNDLNHELSILDKKMEHAFGKEKLDLIREKLNLLKEQQIELQKHKDFFDSKKSQLMNDLSGLGFKFDEEGNITNYLEQLSELGNSSKDFEAVKETLEEYFDIQNNRLPGIMEDWIELENVYKDTLKDQLSTTKEVQDKIKDIYKKQVEERKKLIDEELKKRLDAINKEKDAYNDQREKIDYENNYNEQLNLINELQKKIDLASKDNSLSGKKKLQDLLKQLQDEQKKLQEMVQNKIDSDVNDMFDKESDRLEDVVEQEKENLDNLYSDEKLQSIIDKVLNTGIFEDLNGDLHDLQSVMFDYIDKYGDGLSAIGSIIKSEMITNLEIAKDTMAELANIMNELDMSQYASSMSRLAFPSDLNMSEYGVANNISNSISFNSPLINIEGNVDKGVMSNLESLEDSLVNKVCNQIMTKVNGR